MKFFSKACFKSIPIMFEGTAYVIAVDSKVPDANVSPISIQRLVVAMHIAMYYTSIRSTLTAATMHCNIMLPSFKTDHEVYT